MQQNKMTGLLERLVPEEGVIKDIINSVDLFRITSSSPRNPQKYEPSIIILAQGNKRIFVGDEVFSYDPMNYLVLSVPLPLECETNAEPDKPLLGVRIEVDAATIGEMLLKMDDTQEHTTAIPKAVYSAPLDDKISDAVIRLLEAVSSPQDKKYLAPMIKNEIIYRVLCGEKGEALRALAIRDQRFFRIAKTLDVIHTSYGDKLELGSLAKLAGMSISAYHSGFKSVTNSSPLQYIKNVRLHKAKLLMTEEGLNANNAAYNVGYESPSQFSREYKRLFGVTPARDVMTVQA